MCIPALLQCLVISQFEQGSKLSRKHIIYFLGLKQSLECPLLSRVILSIRRRLSTSIAISSRLVNCKR